MITISHNFIIPILIYNYRNKKRKSIRFPQKPTYLVHIEMNITTFVLFKIIKNGWDVSLGRKFSDSYVLHYEFTKYIDKNTKN